MRNIEEQPNGKFRVRYYQNGVRKSKTFPNLEEAQEFQATTNPDSDKESASENPVLSKGDVPTEKSGRPHEAHSAVRIDALSDYDFPKPLVKHRYGDFGMAFLARSRKTGETVYIKPAPELAKDVSLKSAIKTYESLCQTYNNIYPLKLCTVTRKDRRPLGFEQYLEMPCTNKLAEPHRPQVMQESKGLPDKKKDAERTLLEFAFQLVGQLRVFHDEGLMHTGFRFGDVFLFRGRWYISGYRVFRAIATRFDGNYPRFDNTSAKSDDLRVLVNGFLGLVRDGGLDEQLSAVKLFRHIESHLELYYPRLVEEELANLHQIPAVKVGIHRQGEVSDLGLISLMRSRLKRQLSMGVLTRLRRAVHGKIQRIRIFSFNRIAKELEGVCEIGGAYGNFSRIRIPIGTDPISILSVKNSSVILHHKDKKTHWIWSRIGFPEYSKNPTDQPLMCPHDIPILRRSDLTQWYDVPIISNDGEFIGKMALDSGYQAPGKDVPRVRLDLNKSFGERLWSAACDAATIITEYSACKTKFPSWMEDCVSEENVRTFYSQAFAMELLEDQIMTILGEMKSDPEVGIADARMRVYLTIERQLGMFPELSSLLVKAPPRNNLRGFWARCEVGGVNDTFKELILTESNDFPTAVCIGECNSSNLRSLRPVGTKFRGGSPVVFTADRHNEDTVVPVCRAPFFYQPKVFDNDEKREILDIPIPKVMSDSRGDGILGKISVDVGRSIVSGLSRGQLKRIRHYTVKLGTVIQSAESIRDNLSFFEPLYSATITTDQRLSRYLRKIKLHPTLEDYA